MAFTRGLYDEHAGRHRAWRGCSKLRSCEESFSPRQREHRFRPKSGGFKESFRFRKACPFFVESVGMRKPDPFEGYKPPIVTRSIGSPQITPATKDAISIRLLLIAALPISAKMRFVEVLTCEWYYHIFRVA